jgi:hypothetical protein
MRHTSRAARPGRRDSHPMPPPAPRGRDAGLTAIGEALGTARDGHSSVVVIEGPAGLGKTGARGGRRHGAPCVRGERRRRGRVGRPGRSHGAPLIAALFDGPRQLLDRAALDGFHTAPEERYWLLQGLESLLERATLEEPVMISLDDLPWPTAVPASASRATARAACASRRWTTAPSPRWSPTFCAPRRIPRCSRSPRAPTARPAR